jgi:hypothetical protein
MSKSKSMWPILVRIKEWTLVPVVNLGTIAGVTFLHLEEFLKLMLLIVTIGWTLWQWRQSSLRNRLAKAEVPKDCPFPQAPESCPLFKKALGQLRDQVK